MSIVSNTFARLGLAAALAAFPLGCAATSATSEPAVTDLDEAAPNTPEGALAGRYDASITLKGLAIPFRLDLGEDGTSVVGTLWNGKDTQTSTQGSFEDGKLVLKFEHYLTTIVAQKQGDGTFTGTLEGRFERDRYLSELPFTATRHVESAEPAADVPAIAGLWEIPYESPKGEKAWRFVVEQDGAEVQAAILRIDGDTGALTGRYRDGKFFLSHFDGSRPLVLEITPQGDGTLALDFNGSYVPKSDLVAYRPELARAKGLPEPSNFNTHTTVRDPNEVFAFNLPDVDGKPVSSTDPRFKGKVLVVVVTGTWCPNCHDEAQYLVKLYKKYRDRGLEVIALDFEEPEQQDELTRVRAFVQKYGVEYTYLIAGAPNEMWTQVPQAVNLNTWPATLFVGKDGRVKRIHAGFAAPASGEYHRQLDEEFTSTVERLLAEDVVARTAEQSSKG